MGDVRLTAHYYQQFDADFALDVPGEGYGGWKAAMPRHFVGAYGSGGDAYLGRGYSGGVPRLASCRRGYPAAPGALGHMGRIGPIGRMGRIGPDGAERIIRYTPNLGGAAR